MNASFSGRIFFEINIDLKYSDIFVMNKRHLILLSMIFTLVTSCLKEEEKPASSPANTKSLEVKEVEEVEYEKIIEGAITFVSGLLITSARADIDKYCDSRCSDLNKCVFLNAYFFNESDGSFSKVEVCQTPIMDGNKYRFKFKKFPSLSSKKSYIEIESHQFTNGTLEKRKFVEYGPIISRTGNLTTLNLNQERNTFAPSYQSFIRSVVKDFINETTSKITKTLSDFKRSVNPSPCVHPDDGSMIAHGEKIDRVYYLSSIVAEDEACIETKKVAYCLDGVVSSFIGNDAYQELSCQRNNKCEGDLSLGDRITKEYFLSASVPFGESCEGQKISVDFTCVDGFVLEQSTVLNQEIFERCTVSAPLNCTLDDETGLQLNHLDSTSVNFYSRESVPFGEICSHDVAMELSCNNGVLTKTLGPGVTEYFNTCETLDANSCGGISHGQSETRVRFEEATVAFEESCQSEEQNAICTDGVLGSFDGTFTFESCVVEGPENCADSGLVHEQIEDRVMFFSEEGTTEAPCVSEDQVRSCYNGVTSDWSGSYQFSSCTMEENISIEGNINLVANGNQDGVYLYWSILDNVSSVDILRRGPDDSDFVEIVSGISTTDGPINSGELVPLNSYFDQIFEPDYGLVTSGSLDDMNDYPEMIRRKTNAINYSFTNSFNISELALYQYQLKINYADGQIKYSSVVDPIAPGADDCHTSEHRQFSINQNSYYDFSRSYCRGIGRNFNLENGREFMPTPRIGGTIRIPVFIVDYSDYSFGDINEYPNEFFLNNYVRYTPEKWRQYFNLATTYFLQASGNRVNLIFDIYPINSGNYSGNLNGPNIEGQSFFPSLTNLVDYDDDESRENEDYYFYYYVDAIYEASMSESKMDLFDYDGDHNGVLSGPIFIHEGAETIGARGFVRYNPLFSSNFLNRKYYNDSAFDISSTSGTLHPYVVELSETANHVNHFKQNIYPFMDERAHLVFGNVMEYNENYLFKPYRGNSYNDWGVLVHELGHMLYNVPDYYNDSSYEFNNLRYFFNQSSNRTHLIKESDDQLLYDSLMINFDTSRENENFYSPIMPSGFEKSYYYGFFEPLEYDPSETNYIISSSNLDHGENYLKQNHYLLSGNLDSAGRFKFNIEYRRFNALEDILPFWDAYNVHEDGLVLYISSENNSVWGNKMTGITASVQPKIKRILRAVKNYGDITRSNLVDNKETNKYFSPIVDSSETSFSRTFCINEEKIVPSFFTYTTNLSDALDSTFISEAYRACPIEYKSDSNDTPGIFFTACEADKSFGGLPAKNTTLECVKAACLGVFKGFSRDYLKCREGGVINGCSTSLEAGSISSYTTTYDSFVSHKAHSIEEDVTTDCDETVRIDIDFVRETDQNGQPAIQFSVNVVDQT